MTINLKQPVFSLPWLRELEIRVCLPVLSQRGRDDVLVRLVRNTCSEHSRQRVMDRYSPTTHITPLWVWVNARQSRSYCRPDL